MESDNEHSAQYSAYKQLEEATRCEAHHGHCHVSRKGGSDNHYRLSHQEMTLWAKKMVSYYETSQQVMRLTSCYLTESKRGNQVRTTSLPQF